ncbi:sensor histidine kinase [Cohnella soli]|uniref:histidine kinase n=1 Tax=Cohnella soli TaxID=425005 RepID=A0ABW0HX35_9BACL
MSSRFRIKTQFLLFCTFLGLSSALLLIIYLLLQAGWNRTLPEYKMQLLNDQSHKLAYMMRAKITGGPDNEEQKRWLDNVSKVYSASLRIVAPNRTDVWYESKPGQSQLPPNNSALFEIPIIVGGEEQGYLHVSYELDGNYFFPYFSELERKVNIELKAGGLVLLVMLIALSYFLARKLARPIRTSSELAEKIASGDREATLPETGTSEIVRYTRVVNALLTDFNRQDVWMKQMLQDLSHELRTPLTTVLSRLEAMIDGIYPLTEHHLDWIYSEIDRLSRLVEDVGKLSEAEGASFKLNMERVDLVQVVRSVHEGFLFLAQEKGISCKLISPFIPCFADVDHDRIIQVLSNVISNAIKYTAAGGSIEIGLFSEENETLIYCEDNGIGIAEQDIPLIFNRFYRADKSRSRNSGGLGVGLSIAKALVEAHNGLITVESEQGKGSRFTIHLPVQIEAREINEKN